MRSTECHGGEHSAGLLQPEAGFLENSRYVGPKTTPQIRLGYKGIVWCQRRKAEHPGRGTVLERKCEDCSEMTSWAEFHGGAPRPEMKAGKTRRSRAFVDH